MVAVLRRYRWGRLFLGSVRGGACGPTGVLGAACSVLWAALRRGRRPTREPSAPRAVCSRGLLLVAPRVFWAPDGPAAREARLPHCVRCRASKPARALRSLRRPPHQWGRVADWRIGASARCPARPRDSPQASQEPRALRFRDAPMRVVTNVVNRRCFLCGFLIGCYKRRQSDGFFAENGGFLA